MGKDLEIEERSDKNRNEAEGRCRLNLTGSTKRMDRKY